MTRVLLDACVLFPSITRELLLRVAQAGHFVPLWSERILAEWQRAARRRDEQAGQVAKTEILLLRARWPKAIVALGPEDYANLTLPDANDTHVLGAAIQGGAQELVTANLKDFPNRVLSRHGIIRRDPDGFLLEIAQTEAAQFYEIATDVLNTASQMNGAQLNMRATFRKAGLPRLGKFLDSTT